MRGQQPPPPIIDLKAKGTTFEAMHTRMMAVLLPSGCGSGRQRQQRSEHDSLEAQSISTRRRRGTPPSSSLGDPSGPQTISAVSKPSAAGPSVQRQIAQIASNAVVVEKEKLAERRPGAEQVPQI
jgi:hypothetical protein